MKPSSKKSSATLKALPALNATGCAVIETLLTGPVPACPAPPGAAPAWLSPPPLLPLPPAAPAAPAAAEAPPSALMPPPGKPLPAPALLFPALLLLVPAALAPPLPGGVGGSASELLLHAASSTQPVSSQALPSAAMPHSRRLEPSSFMTGDLGGKHE